ncbi:MAG: DUF5414 family protein [Chlamydiales bacterium]|nr:DUF5414 family protein [Chlamydiia bacterium]MCP5508474.1 DUF5414 family protein [Chlamydiales bacterium]
MFDDIKVAQMHKVFDRIFAMPISRTTFREVQSALLAFCEGKQEPYKLMFEALLTGKTPDDLSKLTKGGELQSFITKFQVKTFVAREVHEKGEFINFITSDLITHPNRVVFANCIRCVDGKELRFLTDIESTLQLLNHFVGRVHEAEKVEASKEAISGFKNELTKLKSKIEELI